MKLLVNMLILEQSLPMNRDKYGETIYPASYKLVINYTTIISGSISRQGNANAICPPSAANLYPKLLLTRIVKIIIK